MVGRHGAGVPSFMTGAPPGLAAAGASAPHRDHRRGRDRPHGASAGVHTSGVSDRRAVRRPQRRGAGHGEAVRHRHRVRHARRRVRGPRRGVRRRRARRSDPRRPLPPAGGRGGAHAKTDGRRRRRRAAHPRRLPRTPADGRAQLPAAVQPQHAGAQAARRRAPPRRDHRHRSPHRRSPAVGAVVVPRRCAAPRSAVPLDPLSRRDQVAGG